MSLSPIDVLIILVCRYKIVDRRPGDIASCYADVSKAERELGGWKATRTIDEVRVSFYCVVSRYCKHTALSQVPAMISRGYA